MITGEAIFLIILAVAVSLFTIIVQWRVKTGKIIPRSTYSYRPIIRVSSIMVCLGILIAVLVYFRTNSLEAALTIGAYVSAVIVGGFALGVLSEYQVKRRGEGARKSTKIVKEEEYAPRITN